MSENYAIIKLKTKLKSQHILQKKKNHKQHVTQVIINQLKQNSLATLVCM